MVYFSQLHSRVKPSPKKRHKTLSPKIQKHPPLPIGHNKNLRPPSNRPSTKLRHRSNKTFNLTYLPLPITNTSSSTRNCLTSI